MFNLPTFTTIVMIMVPLFWVLYTVVFLFVSRRYEEADTEV